ncbi:MAG: crossover junction endodeoxyribonuclease RuvC [Planctomycetota bacterium]|nr:MAG: crossover junction endodeoxyribonuclease RuvC [Planctomycetota bacterium]
MTPPESASPLLRRVLGIDPGTRATGWGVVEEGEDDRPRLVAYGTLRPVAAARPAERLLAIHRGVLALLREHRPGAVALEEAFFGRNVRSAIRLAEARAVCLLAAEFEGLVVHELPPALVKKVVCGHGRASKEGVRRAVLARLDWEAGRRPPPYDASDALAGALCALARWNAAVELAGLPLGRRGRKGSRRWNATDLAALRQEEGND